MHEQILSNGLKSNNFIEKFKTLTTVEVFKKAYSIHSGVNILKLHTVFLITYVEIWIVNGCSDPCHNDLFDHNLDLNALCVHHHNHHGDYEI